jgi:thymidylate synthase (FAD)
MVRMNGMDNHFRTESKTFRPTVPALEPILGVEYPVLDHGFVQLVDYMGDDHAIVQAARTSYGRGTRSTSEDVGLIRYLMRHRHTTPFEMCEIKLLVRLPIFVARQWIRHRTASVNEYSARYSILDREFYIPQPEHLAAQSSTNRQGRGDVLSGEEAEMVMRLLREDAERNYGHYETMLNEGGNGPIDPSRQGLSRELARMNLTLNYYTKWYWKVNLHNLFNFLALRVDHHAQYEIRVYAQKILEIAKLWVPHSVAAFEEYRLGAFTLSATMLELVRKMMVNGPGSIHQQNSGLSKREWTELMGVLGVSANEQA